MINVLDILTDLGIIYYPAGVDNVKVACLNPNHNDTKPSMYIHKETGVFHCFGCGIRGNLLSILALNGIHGTDALLYFHKFTRNEKTAEDIYQELKNSIQNRSSHLIKTLTKDSDEHGNVVLPPHRLVKEHIYLMKRGIKPEEAELWKMGIVTDRMYLGWLLIPIEQDGILRTYFMRSTFGDEKRYGSLPRSDILFGLESARDYSKPLYITEGIFDMIYVRRTRRQAVACLSNRLLPEQQKKLMKYSKIVILPDNDAGGEILVDSAASLMYETDLWICRLPSHRSDPAETTVEELLLSMFNEVKWVDDRVSKVINYYGGAIDGVKTSNIQQHQSYRV